MHYIDEYLTECFGDNIKERTRKLTEEVTELLEARTDTEFVEELADVALVLHHIAGIKGQTLDGLAFKAFSKVVKRHTGGDQRTDHTERTCATCQHYTKIDRFTYSGNCEKNKHLVLNSSICVQWKNRR